MTSYRRGGASPHRATHRRAAAAAPPTMRLGGGSLLGLPGVVAGMPVLHNPTPFADMPAGTAPLAVAGRTHCGQIALPGAPRWSHLGLTEEEQLVADAWVPDDDAAGSALFMTCSIGLSSVPIPINAAPQLVVSTLEAA